MIITLMCCTSTPTTQTTPAALIRNVSAPLFAHPVLTKTKPGSPRANHAPAILSIILPVRLFAHSMPPVAQPVPMPVVQTPFVIYVVLENTIIKPIKLLVKVALLENTKTKREKHPATMIVRVPW